MRQYMLYTVVKPQFVKRSQNKIQENSQQFEKMAKWLFYITTFYYTEILILRLYDVNILNQIEDPHHFYV